MSIAIGSDAPNFELFDSDKNKHTLAALRGSNVLLLFYPQAFTSVCTKELCFVRDNISRYENSTAKVFGISVDSIYTLQQYKTLQQYNFPLLSDFNKEVSTAYESIYDTWNFGMRGVSKRSAFIIDKQGKIRYAEVLENAGDEPNYQEIDKILTELS